MERKSITTFGEAAAYLSEIPRFTAKHSPEETKAFLQRLGSPDKALRIIHVAGTNGKGSVCAYMRSIMEEAGYRTAVFTSPHLVDIRERFYVCGDMVSKEAFLNAFLAVYDRLPWEELKKGEGYHPTFFEYLFFMALLLFKEAKPDFCILETGLGGRLDATNAVSRKELSVITGISLDHTEYLGDTVAQIAAEKAGILAEGTPAVYWAEPEEAGEVFAERSRMLGIFAQALSKKDYTFLKIQNKTIDFSLRTRYYDFIRLTLHTIARYQMENASVAVRALETLDKGRTITAEHIRKGVEGCVWPGRMEEILPEVYLDGAHNEDGVRAFLDTVRADGLQGKRSLLFSAVADKDLEHMIKRLGESGLFERIAVASMHTGRMADTEMLRRLFAANSRRTCCLYDSVGAAFQELLDTRVEGERIYIAGSLYLAGEIKELLSHD